MPSPRVIIDTDPGIDDAQSILFAFLCRQFEIDAVTSVFGNVPVELAALNALRLVELAGCQDVPVYLGAVTVCMKADADGILDWYERVVTSSG